MSRWIIIIFFAFGQNVPDSLAYALISQAFEERENYKLDLNLLPLNNRQFKLPEILNQDFF